MTLERTPVPPAPAALRGAGAAERLRAAVAAVAVPSAVAGHAARSVARGGAPGVSEDLARLVLLSPEAVARALTALWARERGGRGPARRDLRAALDELGADDLRAVLTAGPTYSVLRPHPGPRGVSLLAFSARAAEVARLAAELACHVPGGHPGVAEPARAAGLLHDVGAVVLMGPPAGLRLLPRPDDAPDAAAVGAALCRMWRLAPEVVEAVRHHAAGAPPAGPVGRAVWMAVRVEAARSGRPGTPLDVAAGLCGLDASRLQSALIGDASLQGDDPLDELTPREHEILVRLAAGDVPKQIAVALGCSASTVNNHLHHVYGKLGVSGQAHALLVARERGWV